jgi:hypothetical protein
MVSFPQCSLNQEGVEKSPAKRRVRKNLFPLIEAPSGEPSQQEEKSVEKGGVIIDAVNLEMGKAKSHVSVSQNVKVYGRKVKAGKPSSQNLVDVAGIPKLTDGQETVPGRACIPSYKKSYKIMNKHVDVKKSDTRENKKQATGVPVITPHSGQVLQTCVAVKSESITATNCPSGSSSSTDDKAPSSCVGQGQKKGNVQPVVPAETDIICISDSDDEIECLGSQYNPKLDYILQRKKQCPQKYGVSAVKIEDNLTSQHTHISPKRHPCVQGKKRTYGMGAAVSTSGSVTALSNQFQTLLTNANNNSTYLTQNSTIQGDKVKEDFRVKHNHVETHALAENQSVLTVQQSDSSHTVSGISVLQAASVEHIPGHSTAETVLSPIPTCSSKNNQNIPVRTQDTLIPEQTHIAPRSDPCVQRNIPTCGMGAAASTDSSVPTVPNQLQTVITNPNSNSTYFTQNSTMQHGRVEEEFTVKHNHLGTYTVAENQGSVDESVSTVQPRGISDSVSGNSVLQTDHIQSHVPGLSTTNKILSPFSLSSPQNNPNIPAHDSLVAGETITSVQHSSSMSNGPVHNFQINVGSQIVPSYVPANQVSMQPYIVIVGSSPGTSIQVTAPDTANRPPHARIQDINFDAELARTNSPGSNSRISSRIPYPQSTQTKIPTPLLVDPLLDRARNCHLPLSQTNVNLPVVVTSSHLTSVQTRNPGFSSTPTEHPYTPITHTQHPHSFLANTHVPDVHLLPLSPEGQTRIPGIPLTKTRNSVTTEVQNRSPGTPVAHTTSSGTLLGKTRSPGTQVAYTNSSGIVLGKTKIPGTPMAHTISCGNALGKTRSPGTPMAHTISSGNALGKTRSPGTPVAHTSSSGTGLGKTSSPAKSCVSQASSSHVSVVQARNSGSSLLRAQTPAADINPGGRLPHGRVHSSSRPERDWTGVVQQRDQTARLVVIPGNDNVSRYGLVFPSGAKVILTPEQVAEIRAANGGLLTSNL